MTRSKSTKLSVEEIRTITQQKFGVRPCLWQVQVVQALLKRDRDVISIAGTGMGKTLTFWMPLLFQPKGSIQIIVTPLNLLGKQNVRSLKKAGFRGTFIGGATATHERFLRIENGCYQAVVTSPEQLVKDGGGFERLFKNPAFTNRIISVVFDEAHCISQWGSFRPEYRDVGQIRARLPKNIPFMLTSATLPTHILNDVRDILHIRSHQLEVFRQSISRPNIQVCVRKIINSLDKFEDLKFVLGNWKNPGDEPPPKFLIFFDDIQESISAASALRAMLPQTHHEKIVWFNSNMSDEFKEHQTSRLMSGEIWGLCTTDSFGLGMDCPDIRVVVVWRVKCTLAALWQRIGRGARDMNLVATAVFLVEKDYFDDEKKKKDERQRQRQKDRVEKRKRAIHNINTPSNKQARTQENTMLLHDAVAEDLLDGEEGNATELDHEDKLADLRAEYHVSSTSINVQRRKGGSLEIEKAMDDFINAESRGIRCRRDPIEAYMGGDIINPNPTLCDPGNASGCPRCRVVTPVVCCDIHSPSFSDFIVAPAIKPSRQPARSRIPKMQPPTVQEQQLRTKLQKWRHEEFNN